MSQETLWEFWIDVGGTFTDCLVRSPQGTISTFKLLSSGEFKGLGTGSGTTIVHDLEEAPNDFFRGAFFEFLDGDGQSMNPPMEIQGNQGARLTLKTKLKDDFPDSTSYRITSSTPAPVLGIQWLAALVGASMSEKIVVKLGTTRGTNALLERQGADTLFVTTKGFGDVLEIGYQDRPNLFDLNIRRAVPLYHSVLEIEERIGSRGEVIGAINATQVRADLEKALAQGATSIAVALLNSHKNPEHEALVEHCAKELGFDHISVSSKVIPLQKIVPRADTTLVDAYLTPVIRDYIADISKHLPHADLKLMTSAGGLIPADQFVGKDSILSGPAGGVVGVSNVAKTAGISQAIGFDMGGTSTDVCRFDGSIEKRFEMQISNASQDDSSIPTGARIVAPMLAIETVAAGGGSLCWFDGIQLRVGPQSAGANPGPACYGAGGPLCITDCNLFLGRIEADRFRFPLKPDGARLQLESVQQKMKEAGFTTPTLEEIALGFLQIAASNMAAPIKKISIAKGYDVRQYTLVSFGGAGAQHACDVANELGITSILQHPYASILSAYGIGTADERFHTAVDLAEPLSADFLKDLENQLAAQEKILLADKSFESSNISFVHQLDLRYEGQDAVLEIPITDGSDVRKDFLSAHQHQYGFVFDNRDVEVRALRSELIHHLPKFELPSQKTKAHEPKARSTSPMWFSQRKIQANSYDFGDLTPGATIKGPAKINTSNTCIVITPGWQAEVTDRSDIKMSRVSSEQAKSLSTDWDPIQLSLYNNRLSSMAEQMGATLQKTSLSVNVKERLDFSCAIFTKSGDLVVNAPHIPVHLGAMGDTVKAVIKEMGQMNPGDAFVTNDPYRGGSHLPDVTVICPVFSKAGNLMFFTGNRAHHAEIGGITPGSMPPHSKTLAEEGVLIRPFRLVGSNKQSEQELETLLSTAPYPSRSVRDNLADIRAQVAANEMGRHLLQQMVEQDGEEIVGAYMQYIRQAAEIKMRQTLKGVPPGVYSFTDQMDDQTPIGVDITIAHEPEGGKATVDFTRCGPVHRGNLNANRAIVRAAVLYSFRCLIDEEIPLNDGVLIPINIIVKNGSILSPPEGDDPTKLPAVVGGNVETSTRLVDVILGALGLAAASQGTMNNFLFGKSGSHGFGYYETICGGSGAGPRFNGTSAIHTHMTNTRITDPEVIEERFPVRLNRFEIRQGSGGQGSHSGGDGCIREFEFLEDLQVSIMSQRRTVAPFGLKGGQPGAKGTNLYQPKGTSTYSPIDGMVQLDIKSGDKIRIETPGGGGYGAKI
jgi:5-oxoprolinase (ATP-hydrolysing)